MSEIPWRESDAGCSCRRLCISSACWIRPTCTSPVTAGDVFSHGRHVGCYWRRLFLPFRDLIVAASGLIAAVIPFVHVWWKRKKRFDAFLEHLPDALDLMSRALSAGHAFSEALHMVSQEMPEPIATEFRKTYEEQNLGLSLKLALENLTERMPLMDLRMCVTAI